MVKDQKQWLDYTTLSPEVLYPINVTRPGIKFCLSLHYNESNSFLFGNASKIYQFKGNYSEIKKHPLCLGNISKYGKRTNNMKKTWLNGYAYEFCVDYNIIDTSNIIDTNKSIMKKYDIKNCLD